MRLVIPGDQTRSPLKLRGDRFIRFFKYTYQFWAPTANSANLLISGRNAYGGMGLRDSEGRQDFQSCAMSADRLANLQNGSNRHKNQSVSEDTSEVGLATQICVPKQNSEDTGLTTCFHNTINRQDAAAKYAEPVNTPKTDTWLKSNLMVGSFQKGVDTSLGFVPTPF